jgi:hypothetical protein
MWPCMYACTYTQGGVAGEGVVGPAPQGGGGVGAAAAPFAEPEVQVREVMGLLAAGHVLASCCRLPVAAWFVSLGF